MSDESVESGFFSPGQRLAEGVFHAKRNPAIRSQCIILSGRA